MRYLGGKARISKPLAEFLNGELKDGQPFVDAFCGSCNVISKIDPNRVRVANDKHEYLIAMWKALQNGWIPPDEVTPKMFKHVRENRDEDKPLTAFVGFGCTFAGDWFKGHAWSEKRNYAMNAKNSLAKKMKTLQSVKFINHDYKEIIAPNESLIYCDIPYKDSVGYSKELGQFKHSEFYEWCKSMEEKGYSVYVSEYLSNLPADAHVVWEIESRKSVRDSEGFQQHTKEVVFRFL